MNKTFFNLFVGLFVSGVACSSSMMKKEGTAKEESCSSLMFQLTSIENPTSPEANRLRRLLQIECEKGNAQGCVFLYVAKYFGLGGSTEKKKALEFLLAECKKKIGFACEWSYRCTYLGDLDSDKNRLFVLLQHNCAEGHAKSCTLYGGAYLDGFSTQIDHPKARSQFQAGCDKGDQLGCAGYAVCLDLGLGGKQDPVKARQLFIKACGHNIGDACILLGSFWQDGRGGPKNKSRAKELYEKGCQAWSLLGCNNLAAMWDESKDTGYQLKTRHYYGLACRLGDENACANLRINQSC